ncbi:MAG: hypothetical protein ABW032_02290 [Burkholderiaceae bacterium]
MANEVEGRGERRLRLLVKRAPLAGDRALPAKPSGARGSILPIASLVGK